MEEVLEQVLFALMILLSVFSRHIATCFPNWWVPLSMLLLQPVFQIAGSPCQYFPLALALLSKATLEELLRLENAVFA